MAYGNQGYQNNGPRKFSYEYNERTGFGTYTRLEGVGLVMICGHKNADGSWPVKALDGFKAGEIQDAEERDFVRLDTAKNELQKCRELAGQKSFEPRQFQSTTPQIDFKQSHGNRRDDQPRNLWLAIEDKPGKWSKPFGASPRLEKNQYGVPGVRVAEGQIVLTLHRQDKVTDQQRLPAPYWRLVSSTNEDAIDPRTRTLVRGEKFARDVYVLDFTDSTGRSASDVGDDEDPTVEQSATGDFGE